MTKAGKASIEANEGPRRGSWCGGQIGAASIWILLARISLIGLCVHRTHEPPNETRFIVSGVAPEPVHVQSPIRHLLFFSQP